MVIRTSIKPAPNMLRKLLLWLTLWALVLPACASPAPSNAVAGQLKVVATFSVLGDFAQQVGGDHIALTTLVGPNLDAHTFAPTPADGVALAEADIVLENGLGFEPWLDNLYAATETAAKRVVVTEDLPLLAAGEEDEHPNDRAGDAHQHGTSDPHVWHSVTNAILMVKNIRDAFSAADPAHAADYAANADRYIAELQALDQWVYAQVATVPADKRLLLTNHDTLRYFAQRYGFTVLGTVFPNSTEGAAPSAAMLAELVAAVKTAGVPAVFAENVTNPTLIQQLAEEAGVTVVSTLYTDALGPSDAEGNTYITMLRANVTAIVTALNAPSTP